MLNVAAFDFDGTLTSSGTIVRFLRELAGSWGVLRAGLLAVPDAGLPPDRSRFKAAAVGAAVRGRGYEEVERVADRFARDLIDHGLDVETLRTLRRHQAAGDRVVIVTAALEVYVARVAAHLNVDDVLGAQLDVGPDGRCTGTVRRAGLRGMAKVDCLLEHLNVATDDLVLWAYGDSSDDDELLRFADATRARAQTGRGGP